MKWADETVASWNQIKFVYKYLWITCKHNQYSNPEENAEHY